MNSDEIERLRALAMTAPEVSRSTETRLLVLPKARCFELTLRHVGLCASWCNLAAQNIIFGLLQVFNIWHLCLNEKNTVQERSESEIWSCTEDIKSLHTTLKWKAFLIKNDRFIG